jgi:hypothetical protein
VVIEADTYLSFSNMLLWLKTMDSNLPIYAGAQNIIGDTLFAHGGSGVVISRKAADLLREARERDVAAYDAKWERITSVSCCGDEILARAFIQEANVHLTPSWPLIQGETVASLDWTYQHWCAPPITWHHVSPIEIDSLWQFESDWIEAHGWSTPYLFRDVFERFVDRHVTVNRTKWNNLSKDYRYLSQELSPLSAKEYGQLQDWEKQAPTNRDACAAACEGVSKCIQWMFTSGRCYLGTDVRFGMSDESEEQHWDAGWMQDRVEHFKDRLRDCDIRWGG